MKTIYNCRNSGDNRVVKFCLKSPKHAAKHTYFALSVFCVQTLDKILLMLKTHARVQFRSSCRTSIDPTHVFIIVARTCVHVCSRTVAASKPAVSTTVRLKEGKKNRTRTNERTNVRAAIRERERMSVKERRLGAPAHFSAPLWQLISLFSFLPAFSRAHFLLVSFFLSFFPFHSTS